MCSNENFIQVGDIRTAKYESSEPRGSVHCPLKCAIGFEDQLINEAYV
jgi:hypothetical protein